MKIRCERNSLAMALSVVSRAVSPKSSLPALEGVLLRTMGSSLQLVGYDLDTGIETHVDAKVEKKGEIVLPAKMLLDMVRKMAGEMIEITVGDKYLTELSSSNARYTIVGMSADEFPEFPSIGDSASVLVEQKLLKSMIEQTLFAISQNDSKPVHTGSLFELYKEGEIRVVSVDGFRLALRREKAKVDNEIRFIVPGKALAELSRILTDSAEAAELYISRRHIIADVGEFKVYSRLLEGEFLDYNNAIPNNTKTLVKVNVRAFIDSIERASLLISDRMKSPLRVKITKNEINISCSTALGRASDSLACSIVSGDEIEMGFNNRYLLDALKNADCDEVLLDIAGALSPMKVLPPEGEDFLFLVLPVRMKAD